MAEPTYAATPGSPFANLADQIAKSFVPNAQKYSNGSPFGRWQGTNQSGFGLLPSSLPDLFGYKAPTPMPWSRPWGLNQGGGGAGFPQQGTPPGGGAGGGGLFGGGPGGPGSYTPPPTSSWGPTTRDNKYPGVIFVPGMAGAGPGGGIVNTNPDAPQFKPTPVPGAVDQVNNQQWSGKPLTGPWPANYTQEAIPQETLAQYAMRVGFPTSELGALIHGASGLGLPAGASYADKLNAYNQRFHP